MGEVEKKHKKLIKFKKLKRKILIFKKDQNETKI